jgi:hypothetical protein
MHGAQNRQASVVNPRKRAYKDVKDSNMMKFTKSKRFHPCVHDLLKLAHTIYAT